MKVVAVVLSSLTILMALSQLICGLWIQAQHSVDPSSLSFHSRLGIATVVMAVATVAVMLVRVLKA